MKFRSGTLVWFTIASLLVAGIRLRAAESPVLFPIVVNGRIGFINQAGQVVIPPRFRFIDLNGARYFQEGLQPTQFPEDDRHHYGYIDPKGQTAIEPRFNLAEQFSDGLAAVRGDGGKWGYIDHQGALVIPFTFDQAGAFVDGHARVESAKRNGFIDKKGVFGDPPPGWSSVPPGSDFPDGLKQLVGGHEKMAFVDPAGTIVFRLPEGVMAGRFSEGLVNVMTDQEPRGRWGYVDRKGQWAIEPRFQQARPFCHGLALVSIDFQLAYIDQTGKYVWGPHSVSQATEDELRTQITAADYRKYREELLDLARDVDAEHPPLTGEMLDKAAEFRLDRIVGNRSEAAHRLLRKLLVFATDPSQVPRDPYLTLLAQQRQLGVRITAAGALVELGDPTVLPTLRRWLAEGPKPNASPLFAAAQVNAAVDGLRQAHDEASVPAIEKLLETLEFKPAYQRHALWCALAEIGAARSRPILLAALQAGIADGQVRTQIAAGLVRMHEPAGRELILREYDASLEALRTGKGDLRPTSMPIALLGDPDLLAAFHARRDSEPPGAAKNDLISLVDLMEVSAMSDEQLKAALAQDSPQDIGQRIHAIEVMGARGGKDLVPFLEDLRGAPYRPEQERFAQMRGPYIEKALRSIRLREGAKAGAAP